MSSKKKKADNTKWQVLMHKCNLQGDTVAKSVVGLPSTYERAIEVYKYKVTREVRGHVKYTVASVEEPL
jgi:hypothetical protein